MPQHHRSVAFSTKKKKEQLKAKRERKKFVSTSEYESNKPTSFDERKNISSFQGKKIPFPSKKPSQPFELKRNSNSETLPQNYFLDEVEEIGCGLSSKSNRYNLKFRKANKGEGKLTKAHYEPIILQSEEALETDCITFFPPGLDYPKRPPWNKNMSRAKLDQSENRSFRLFCQEIDKNFASDELSLYELNLETWRQLWRVTEMSDILLIIVDARYSAAQFPPYIYKHLVEKENKGVILILNKCDMLPPSLVLAWQDYFTENFPKLIVLPFSSLEGKAIKKSNLKIATHSSLRLIQACETLVDGDVDLNLWRQKVEDEKDETGSSKCEILQVHECENTEPEMHQSYKNGILTIGTIGHPNVGKSSLINALMGKKVVSVSKTPGHTKYFQTIFITKNIKLCDCPGLVFPSLCPKQLQVIIGSYPVAQLRDPISSVHYIASKIDIPSTLKLHSEDQENNSKEEFQWSPFYICEAWAKRRGYHTRTKGGRPDVFRAANELLRFTLVGFKSLVISLKPPDYSKKKEIYKSDPRQHDIQLVQGVHAKSFEDDNESESEDVKQTSENDDDSEIVTSSDEKNNSDDSDDNESSDEDSNDFLDQGNKFALLSVNN